MSLLLSLTYQFYQICFTFWCVFFSNQCLQ